VNIVRANSSNIGEAARLALKLWPENSLDHLRVEFEELLASEKDAVFLAAIEGTYAGFIHMSLRSDFVEGSRSRPVGYIEGIYVDEPYRNRGIARELAEAGEQWAKSLGCKEVASDAALDNVESQEFHKKLGFREAGRIVAFIKEIV